MLSLNVPFGDSLVIDGGRIVITFQERSGKKEVRILVDADRSIPVTVSPKGRHSPATKGLTVNNKTTRKSGEVR